MHLHYFSDFEFGAHPFLLPTCPLPGLILTDLTIDAALNLMFVLGTIQSADFDCP